MEPERSYLRIAALTVVGALAIMTLSDWLLTTPADKYVLLPDHPHAAATAVSVSGIKPQPTRDGAGIYYLDVFVHQAILPESWLARFESDGSVLPEQAIVPPGADQADLDRIDRLDLADSKIVAAVVALRALGRKVTVEPTGVTFEAVLPTAPAAGAGLRAGMVITAVDGAPTPTVSDLKTSIKSRKPGSPVVLSVLDGKRKFQIHTQLARAPAAPHQAIIGVLLPSAAPPRVQLPVRVTITTAGLGGGPSAGLAFTLEVYDTLTGHHLAKGRRIAVTGTMNLAGSVGAIGGVRQKVLGAVAHGADLVIVPKANAADARAAAHGRVPIKTVGSFSQALAAIGAKPPIAPD